MPRKYFQLETSVFEASLDSIITKANIATKFMQTLLQKEELKYFIDCSSRDSVVLVYIGTKTIKCRTLIQTSRQKD